MSQNIVPEEIRIWFNDSIHLKWRLKFLFWWRFQLKSELILEIFFKILASISDSFEIVLPRKKENIEIVNGCILVINHTLGWKRVIVKFLYYSFSAPLVYWESRRRNLKLTLSKDLWIRVPERFFVCVGHETT